MLSFARMGLLSRPQNTACWTVILHYRPHDTCRAASVMPYTCTQFPSSVYWAIRLMTMGGRRQGRSAHATSARVMREAGRRSGWAVQGVRRGKAPAVSDSCRAQGDASAPQGSRRATQQGGPRVRTTRQQEQMRAATRKRAWSASCKAARAARGQTSASHRSSQGASAPVGARVAPALPRRAVHGALRPSRGTQCPRAAGAAGSVGACPRTEKSGQALTRPAAAGGGPPPPP